MATSFLEIFEESALSVHVIISVWGEDRPGILRALVGALSGMGAELFDLEQLSSKGKAFLTMEAGLRDLEAGRLELEGIAAALGVRALVEEAGEREPTGGSRWELIAIGSPMDARKVERLASALEGSGANIEKIERLSPYPAPGEPGALGSFPSGVLHFTLRLPPGASADPLRGELLRLAGEEALDLALQKESVFRKSKRMVVMDMDSTLIEIEVIDELARVHGVYEKVAAITERAMRGELDFDESLRERVALLQGLDANVVDELASRLPLMQGAEVLTKVLRRLGFKLAVISGGFQGPAEALRQRLGLDHAFANTLEVADGRLTGKVVGPIVNAERKAELLESVARQEGIPLDQVIAVGDGANDLLMLRKAGLGIAFRGKPALRRAADISFSHSGLDAILFLLGLSFRELEELQG